MKNIESDHFISHALILWYEKHKRELPWRNTKDPYIIWISEIILQQTRVNQGLDYFLNFINLFPDVNSLASASEDEVMKSWQGLGYYSRARNLHQAAKDIMSKFNGNFPKNYADIISLKGIGEYTAAAIVSFVFDAPYAVVDGNVFRVLSRLFSIDTPIDSTLGKKMFYELAKKILNPKKAGTHNQAIMEFGALQCTPYSPNCVNCPLNEKCLANSQNKVNQLPVKQGKTKTKDRYFNYFCIVNEDFTFLRKRTGKDIWKNLYELPLIETPSQLSFEKLLLLPEFKKMFPDFNEYFFQNQHTQKHILSHQIIHATFYKAIITGENEFFNAEYLKIPISELHNYAVSQLIHNYLDKLL